MAEGRCFFALWPGEEVRERLALEAKRASSKGRVQHPGDLHLTLVFLGPVKDAQWPCVEVAAAGIRGLPFTLDIQRTGYWLRPRILWAAPTETPAALSRLVADLNLGLGDCGFASERRAYKPHVTLLRKVVGAVPGVIDPPIRWPVSEFVLATSGAAEPGMPRYRVLRRWPLLPG